MQWVEHREVKQVAQGHRAVQEDPRFARESELSQVPRPRGAGDTEILPKGQILGAPQENLAPNVPGEAQRRGMEEVTPEMASGSFLMLGPHVRQILSRNFWKNLIKPRKLPHRCMNHPFAQPGWNPSVSTFSR